MHGRDRSHAADRKPRIVVIHRRSTYTALVSERRSEVVARLVRRRSRAVRRMLQCHEEHMASLAAVRREISRLGLCARFLHRTDGLRISDDDLVVTVGGDGTVLHASHLVDKASMLPINSSPSTSCGFLTVATADGFGPLLEAALHGRLRATFLQRMRVEVAGRVKTDRVLNDILFSNACPASTTRYSLRHRSIEEDQFSSGIWVATAAGSTSAVHAAGGRILPLGSRLLQFVVREPFHFAPPAKRYRLVRGFVRPGGALAIVNKWQPATVYVDGPNYTIPVSRAQSVRLSLSPSPLRLLGYDPGRRGAISNQQSLGSG